MNREQFDEMVALVERRANEPGAITPFISAGRVNAYVCDLCADVVVAIVRDPGRSPFRLPCAATIHGPEPDPAPGLSARILKRLANVNDGTFTRKDLKRMPDARPVSMRSVGFEVAGQVLKAENATIELYRPAFDEFDRLPVGAIRHHIAEGGLWFRAIGATTGDGLEVIAITETAKEEQNEN